MLATMSLRMVHPSRLVLELSPDEIHRRRRIHRSGRGTSRGWRSGEHLGVEKPAIQEIWPSRRLSTLTAPSRNRSPACPLAAIDTSRHGVLIGVTTTLLGPAGPCRAGPGQLPAGRQVSNPELAAVPLRRHEWHGECNYTALPAAA
jgi:hypothetical protein